MRRRRSLLRGVGPELYLYWLIRERSPRLKLIYCAQQLARIFSGFLINAWIYAITDTLFVNCTALFIQ